MNRKMVYTVQVKIITGAMVTYHSVNGNLSLKRLINYFDTKYINENRWLFCNVYDKNTKELVANYLNGKNNQTRP